MKQKTTDMYSSYCQEAQYSILKQNKPFSFQDLLNQFLIKHGRDVSVAYARDILIETLNSLLDHGLIKPDKDEEGIYYTIFIENKLEQLKRSEDEFHLE